MQRGENRISNRRPGAGRTMKPKVYERTTGSHMVSTMAMMMMMISITFNLQLVRGSESHPRLDKPLVISLRTSPHENGRPL